MAFENLPTLAEMSATRRAVPKHQIATRLEEKTKKDGDFEARWRACCKAVDKRDGPICRCCGVRVVATLELQANRREHHHIVRRRKVAALMTDARNVLVLCQACHEKITRNLWHIVGTAKAMFALEGKRYLDAGDKSLKFLKGKVAA
jgi:hypothetical protein